MRDVPAAALARRLHLLVAWKERDVVEREHAMHDDGVERGEHDACDYDTYSLASGSSRQLLNDRLEEGQF